MRITRYSSSPRAWPWQRREAARLPERLPARLYLPHPVVPQAVMTGPAPVPIISAGIARALRSLYDNPVPADLLLYMAHNAALCSAPESLSGLPTVTPAEAARVLSALPSILELTASNDARAQLDAVDPMAAPMLAWSLNVIDRPLMLVAPGRQLREPHTPYQFVFAPLDAEREAQFRSLPGARHYMFHGTTMAQWHALLRNSVQEGAEFVLTRTLGAAAAAAQSDVQSRPNSELFRAVCVGLYEVVGTDAPKDLAVVSDPSQVMLRAFLVYSHGVPPEERLQADTYAVLLA